jgi:hypothetical protein
LLRPLASALRALPCGSLLLASLAARTRGFSSPLINFRYTKIGGERGIRTPGTLRLSGFQDRRIKPLCHLSDSVSGEESIIFVQQKKDVLIRFSCKKSASLLCERLLTGLLTKILGQKLHQPVRCGIVKIKAGLQCNVEVDLLPVTGTGGRPPPVFTVDAECRPKQVGKPSELNRTIRKAASALPGGQRLFAAISSTVHFSHFLRTGAWPKQRTTHRKLDLCNADSVFAQLFFQRPDGLSASADLHQRVVQAGYFFREQSADQRGGFRVGAINHLNLPDCHTAK